MIQRVCTRRMAVAAPAVPAAVRATWDPLVAPRNVPDGWSGLGVFANDPIRAAVAAAATDSPRLLPLVGRALAALAKQDVEGLGVSRGGLVIGFLQKLAEASAHKPPGQPLIAVHSAVLARAAATASASEAPGMWSALMAAGVDMATHGTAVAGLMQTLRSGGAWERAVLRTGVRPPDPVQAVPGLQPRKSLARRPVAEAVDMEVARRTVAANMHGVASRLRGGRVEVMVPGQSPGEVELVTTGSYMRWLTGNGPQPDTGLRLPHVKRPALPPLALQHLSIRPLAYQIHLPYPLLVSLATGAARRQRHHSAAYYLALLDAQLERHPLPTQADAVAGAHLFCAVLRGLYDTLAQFTSRESLRLPLRATLGVMRALAENRQLETMFVLVRQLQVSDSVPESAVAQIGYWFLYCVALRHTYLPEVVISYAAALSDDAREILDAAGILQFVYDGTHTSGGRVSDSLAVQPATVPAWLRSDSMTGAVMAMVVLALKLRMAALLEADPDHGHDVILSLYRSVVAVLVDSNRLRVSPRLQRLPHGGLTIEHVTSTFVEVLASPWTWTRPSRHNLATAETLLDAAATVSAPTRSRAYDLVAYSYALRARSMESAYRIAAKAAEHGLPVSAIMTKAFVVGHYRAGNRDEARRWLEKSLFLSGIGDETFLAIAQDLGVRLPDSRRQWDGWHRRVQVRETGNYIKELLEGTEWEKEMEKEMAKEEMAGVVEEEKLEDEYV